MDEDEIRQLNEEVKGEAHDHYCLTHGEWRGCTFRACADDEVLDCPRDDHPPLGWA